jgi:hypothetical protein
MRANDMQPNGLIYNYNGLIYNFAQKKLKQRQRKAKNSYGHIPKRVRTNFEFCAYKNII